MKTTTLNRTLAGTGALVFALTVGACGSSTSSSTTTTTSSSAHSQNFQLLTPDGQITGSLNGQLPPNWPAAFPLPSGATPAGSGSVAGDENGAMVAIYETHASPEDTFNFYKNNTSLTTSNATSVGAGSSFVGSVKLSGSYNGRVTVTSDGSNGTHIVVMLKK